MKLRLLFCAALACPLALVAGAEPGQTGLNHPRFGNPHLRKQGTATQLIVDGKPFLALAGELLNSSATSLEYMKPLWPEFAKAKLKHPLAGRFLEPDRTAAREVRLHGAGRRDSRARAVATCVSCFSGSEAGRTACQATRPDWVKKDFERSRALRSPAARASNC